MNENKGVFGLNMLSWWKTEGNLDRVLDPLSADLEAGRLKPVVSEAFPFDRAADAHRFIGDRKNVGKVVLTPE
jgi:NADPH:quinone reductase-like Zn-dependent oxidoreductase